MSRKPNASAQTAEIGLLAAIAPVGVMLVLLVLGSRTGELNVNLLVPVMAAAGACAGFIAVRRGHSFARIQQVTGDKLAAVFPMLLILLGIGMLIGSWMLGGTIPLMIYYGLRIVDPQYLLLTAFLVTSAMSLATGTSFGSAGTIGVALMGMAGVTGVSEAACAGAVLSGAYFGDKMSPLSDTTNISAIGAGADLYEHIRHMLYTAVPGFVLASVVYLIAGMGGESNGSSEAAVRLLADIEAAFPPHLAALIPPVLVIVGVMRKTPPVLAMTASSVSALAIGMLVYDFHIGDAMTSAVSGFNQSMAEGLRQDYAFSADFSRLVNRGGLYSMVGNFVVIIAAFVLAAGMEVSGALDKIIQTLLNGARGVFGLIAGTMAAGGVMIGLTSHGGVTALVVGNLFQAAYDKRGMHRVNLSRSLEDSVTLTEPLMPWTVSAVFMAGTLGVATLDYLPWAVFLYSGTVSSLLLAAAYSKTGFGLRKAPLELDSKA